MWYPDVTVAAICEVNGRFLLVEERAKSSNLIVFNQPAGHIEKNESIIDAVIRETREETCRHFTPEALVGLYQYQASPEKMYIRYTFCGSISDVDNLLTLDPDIMKTHWLDIDQLNSKTNLRSPLVLDCINEYLKGTRFPLSLIKKI